MEAQIIKISLGRLAQYEYKPLKENEIRLLKILPGLENTSPSLVLEHHTLDNLPSYVALSYTWGSNKNQFSVRVNDGVLAINWNLYCALRQFRRSLIVGHHPKVMEFWNIYHQILGALPSISIGSRNKVFARNKTLITSELKDGLLILKSPQYFEEGQSDWRKRQGQELALTKIIKRIKILWMEIVLSQNLPMLEAKEKYIWIDAICINQADDEEKIVQIQIMKDIYKRAASLTVWLGPAISNSGLAFSTIRRFRDEVMEHNCEMKLKHLFHGTGREWRAVRQLFRNSYFNRSWIVQEYALGATVGGHGPHQINFCCGTESILNLLDIGANIMASRVDIMFGETPKTRFQAIGDWKSLSEFCRLRFAAEGKLKDDHVTVTHPLRKIPSPNLVALLWQFGKHQATNPSDKLYSVLGLAETLHHGSLEDMGYIQDELIIDYKAEPEDVYSSIVRSVVLATRRLDLFGLAYKSKNSNIKRSWTPDWSEQVLPVSEFALCSELVLCNQHLSRAKTFRFLYDVLPGTQCEITDNAFAYDLSTFSVRGFVIGTISKTACSEKPSSTVSRLEGSLFILGQCQKFLQLPFLGLPVVQHHKPVPIESLVDILLLNLPNASQTSQEQFRAMRPRWIFLLQEWLDFWMKGPTEEKREHIQSPGTQAEEQTLFEVLTATLADPDWKTMVFATDAPYIGLAMVPVEENDILCALPGCARPMVLRPIEDHFLIISEAWVSGIMHGELLGNFVAGKFKMRDFVLH